MADPSTERLGFSVEAFNTATDSKNRMHDNTVARTFGFDGGLVPGVVLLAYLAHPPASRWRLDWLSEGFLSARFSRAVYHDDMVSITAEIDGSLDEMSVALTGADGEPRASALARAVADTTSIDVDTDAASTPPRPLPDASPESLAPGTVLAPWAEQFDGDESVEYLARIGAPPSVFTERRVAHPGWLVSLANSILAANVALGPWIHASSEVSLRGPVGDGQLVVAHGRVRDEFERKGHRFVVVDCALTEGDRSIADIVHTAIYAPRLSSVVD